MIMRPTMVITRHTIIQKSEPKYVPPPYVPPKKDNSGMVPGIILLVILGVAVLGILGAIFG